MTVCATGFVRCLTARATHASHRARILGLGLSVGIAIAGCTPPAFQDAHEADDVRYSTVSMIIQMNEPGAAVARRALADGKLTNAEYDAIIAVGDARQKITCARAKLSTQLLAKGRIPAGKSFDIEEACHWGNLVTNDWSVFAFPVDGGGWHNINADASAIEAPTGVETAQTGSTEGESAAPSGETPR